MMSFSGRKHLIPIQVIYFFLFSGLACLTPFLSPHTRDLGLTYRETIVVNTAAAFISIFGPLIAGIIADRHAKYKTFIVLSLFLSAVSYTGLLFIPRVLRFTRQPIIEFDCPDAVRLEKCSSWSSCTDAGIITDNMTTFTLSGCQYQCRNTFNTTYPLHVCFQGSKETLCTVYDQQTEKQVKFQSRFVPWMFEEQQSIQKSVFLSATPEMPDHIGVCNFRPVAPIIFNEKVHQDIHCRPMPEHCSIKCFLKLTYKNHSLDPAPCEDVLGDSTLTFWVYLGVRSFADLCIMTVICLLDAVTISSINDFYGLYGRMHVWAALGLAIFSPVAGILIDYYSGIAGKPDYSPAIFIFDGLALITCALIIALPIEAGTNARYVVSPERSRKKLKFCTWEMSFLIFLVLILGTQWGFMETFLLWFYVDEVGCSKLILGLTVTVGFVGSIPFLIISKNMVRNIGRAHLIVFAFLFYGIRFAGISYIIYPWWSLPFEAMETFTISVAWIGIVAYGQSLISRGARLKVQYLFNLLHFCAGRGLGTMIGGFLSEVFGTRQTFRGFAVVSTIIGLLYLVIYHTCLKSCRRNKRPTSPVRMNGSWYPLGETRPNGDAGGHLFNSDHEDSDIGVDDDVPK
ncbi:major facilitator superfamily domain-containing protein 6-A-like isoform X1 [Centruroides vittatus]|uniref:major facilitator superfamily domain-containing protein 6-A-like isoform X1 n=1 Tax=Centruroides vittatus TaxID=120091 RepID=UPI00350F23E5